MRPGLMPALPPNWPRIARGERPALAPGTTWPRVSLVTPSYNQGEYLEDAILSVLHQGYPDLEYFIMDGASTDRTKEILEAYASRLAGWESVPDRGQAHAINKGWRRATGKYLWWLNADDMLMPGALYTAAAYLEAHPEVDLVFGDHVRITGDGRPIDVYRYPAFDLTTFELDRPDVSQPGALMRATVLERVGYLDETLHYLMDLDYWRRMALAGCRLVHLDAPLAVMRIHDDSKTSAGSSRAAEERAILNERLFADARLPEAIRRSRARVTSLMHIYRARTLVLCGEYRAGLGEAVRSVRVWAWQVQRRPFWHQAGLALLGLVLGRKAWRSLRAVVRRMRGDLAAR